MDFSCQAVYAESAQGAESVQDLPDHREEASFKSKGHEKVFTWRLEKIAQLNCEVCVKV